MKRAGHLIEQIASLENLYLAYNKAVKGKQRKKEVLQFNEHFDENIQGLREGIIKGTIEVGNYHYFTIHDPKERVICAAPFHERVLQHAIMNVCHQHFDRTLIDSTYATRKGKGVYSAINKAVEAMSHYNYTVKLDYRKFYDTVDHDILKIKLRRLFKDRCLLNLFDKIIDSYNVCDGRGLPIGNLTSQYFANLYLSELDHKAKEQWQAKIYIRYMDDILIACNEKDVLKTCVSNMTDYSNKCLKLTFKPPIYRDNKVGQTFLGYKILPYHYKLSGRSKRRFRSKLLKYCELLDEGIWSEEQYEEHILPLLSFANHAESNAFREACIKIVEGDNRRVGLTA